MNFPNIYRNQGGGEGHVILPDCDFLKDGAYNYVLLEEIGIGTHSMVYKARNKMDNDFYAVKWIRPSVFSLEAVKNEIEILHHLKESSNIINYYTTIFHPFENTVSMIFEYTQDTSLSSLMEHPSEKVLSSYLRQILKGLDYCHNKNIIHRDLKPVNIIYDLNRDVLKIIDWGFAVFYKPNTSYNVKVGSTPYKPPEMLVGYTTYTTSVDIWAFGCIFASILSGREPYFNGKEDFNQLLLILSHLGTSPFEQYIANCKINVGETIIDYVERHPRKPLNWWKFKNLKSIVSPIRYKSAIELLGRILIYDHTKRLSASEILNHEFFKL